MISRRLFALGLVCMPAVVRAGALMRVRAQKPEERIGWDVAGNGFVSCTTVYATTPVTAILQATRDGRNWFNVPEVDLRPDLAECVRAVWVTEDSGVVNATLTISPDTRPRRT